MFNKKVLFGILSFFTIVTSGFVMINATNTKALSPIGNTEDNYEMVSETFGEDFEEFIKDNAAIKIYPKDDDTEDTTIRVFDKELRIKKENPISKVILNISASVGNTFSNVKNSIYKKIEAINGEDEENINKGMNNNMDLGATCC